METHMDLCFVKVGAAPLRRGSARAIASRTRWSASLEQSPYPSPARRATVFGSWGTLLTYVTFFRPDSLFERSLFLEEIFRHPLSPDLNPVAFLIFTGLPVWAAIYLAVLLPGWESQQKQIKPLPFLSFAVGSFTMLPYLGFRNLVYKVDSEFSSRKAALFENRWVSAALTVSAVGLFANVFGTDLALMDYISEARWQEYLFLFRIDPLIHIASVDFAFIWLAFLDPLIEDMQRRRMFKGSPQDLLLAAVIMVTPLLGPCFWLLTRPNIDTFSVQKQAEKGSQ